MRVLHNQSAVSGEHESASKFLKLRDETRKNALIYMDTLLPKSDDVVRKIKAYAYEIRISSFEEWQESLEEITQEITEAEKACNLLMQLHESLITELKKNEDDAVVGIQELVKLKQIYDDDKEKLFSAAAENLKNKEWYDRLGLVLAVPTLGIGTAIASVKSTQQKRLIETNILKATASGKNGEITQEAVNLTKKRLIPAIASFLTGLKACSAFLTATRVELSEMGAMGRKSQEDAKKRYFRLMKKHAEELDSNCMDFITSSSHIRTDLKAIPSEPSDQNYVDKWLSDQLDQFKTTDPGPNILGSVFNQVLKLTQQDGRNSPKPSTHSDAIADNNELVIEALTYKRSNSDQ
jgi:hypothetical protein